MENTQGGKDEFEVKMEADKEKRADGWKGVFFVLFCLFFGKYLRNKRKLEISDNPRNVFSHFSCS